MSVSDDVWMTAAEYGGKRNYRLWLRTVDQYFSRQHETPHFDEGYR